MNKHCVTFVVLIFALTCSFRLHALTTKQFFSICESAKSECVDVPILQAYIGASLDLLATLDEKTDYLDQLYCAPPDQLFDVSKIMRFMYQNKENYMSQNAMLLVIRYFEEKGECDVSS